LMAAEARAAVLRAESATDAIFTPTPWLMAAEARAAVLRAESATDACPCCFLSGDPNFLGIILLTTACFSAVCLLFPHGHWVDDVRVVVWILQPLAFCWTIPLISAGRGRVFMINLVLIKVVLRHEDCLAIAV